RRRHAARVPDLGQHDRVEPALSQHRAVDDLRARRMPRAGRARDQPAGRWLARPPRPATRAADVTMAAGVVVEDLRTHFFTRGGIVRAVDGVSFTVGAGETVSIVGESGCGKSVTSLSIMRLIPPKSGRIVGGHVRFDGKDLAALSEPEMRR